MGATDLQGERQRSPHGGADRPGHEPHHHSPISHLAFQAATAALE